MLSQQIGLCSSMQGCLGLSASMSSSHLGASATTARQLRVLHVTLMSWTLRAAVHASNPTPEGMAHSRHAVKLWIQVYSVLWDVLHVRMVWDWAGHVFRRGEGDLTYQAILHLKSHFRFSGARGVRTGPQNIGHKQLVAFLHRQGIHSSTAADRQLWAEYADLWVCYCGLCSQPCGEVMWQHNTDSYLGIGRVSVQGTFTGQEIWCLTVDGEAWCRGGVMVGCICPCPGVICGVSFGWWWPI